MEQLAKTEHLNQLFSFYGKLLTEKQQNYFTSYYHNDLSLQEIASNYGVSRNAIHDQLKKVENHLLDFEAKLKLYELSIKRNELLNKLENTQDLNLIDKLRKLDEE